MKSIYRNRISPTHFRKRNNKPKFYLRKEKQFN